MKNKRGSHVGVVVSFMIFVTFLIFVFVVLRPVATTQKDKQVLLESIQNEIIENSKAELISSSINVVEGFDPAFNCLIIDQNLVSDKRGVIVKNAYEETVDSWLAYSEGKLIISFKDKTNRFFKIFYSDEFGEGNSGLGITCGELVEGDNFNRGQTKAKDYVFESKIEELNQNYFEDKTSLKEELGVTPGSEFAFTFETGGEDSVTYGEVIQEVSASIFANEESVQFVDQNANIKQGKLRVFVW